MTGPVDPDRDQLIETGAAALAKIYEPSHVALGMVPPTADTCWDEAKAVIDGIWPHLVFMRQQWQQEGRNQAAEAIEAAIDGHDVRYYSGRYGR